jgi:hypothetical protein
MIMIEMKRSKRQINDWDDQSLKTNLGVKVKLRIFRNPKCDLNFLAIGPKKTSSRQGRQSYYLNKKKYLFKKKSLLGWALDYKKVNWDDLAPISRPEQDF